MNKLEKYINYVVGDLVKNTEIDYGRGKIKYPHYPSHSFLFFNTLSSKPSFSSLSSSSKYIRERYGAKEEIQIIWNLYQEKILSLFKK